MYNPFDSDRILADAKKNHVVTHCGQTGFNAKFGPQPIELRLFGYLFHPRAKLTKQSHRMAWAVLCNEIHDLFKVSRYTRG